MTSLFPRVFIETQKVISSRGSRMGRGKPLEQQYLHDMEIYLKMFLSTFSIIYNLL